MITPQQIQELLNTIDKNQTVFIAQSMGEEFLTVEDKQLLELHGIDWNTIYSSRYDTVFNSFHFGLLAYSISDIETKELTYVALKKYINSGKYIPLTLYQKEVLNSIKNQNLKDIKTLKGRIFSDVNQILLNNTPAEQQEFIKKEISDGVENGMRIKQIANEISHKTGDWSRDFDRITQFISQTAFEQGKAVAIQRRSGKEDPLVYKQVYQGACKHCIRLYLSEGLGSQPIIFKLSQLKKNGTNIGVKSSDWKPVIGPLHPYCYDDQTEVLTNEGWKFFKDLNKTESFLSVNLQTGEGEWSKAVSWVNEKYIGPLHSFQNKNFDLVTTPNHHHVIKTYKGPKLRLVETKNLPVDSQFLSYLPKWTGIEQEDFIFDNKKYDGDDFVEMLGFFISEGCIVRYKSQIRLHIAQSKKKYYEDIYEVLFRIFGDRVIRCDGYLQVNLSNNFETELIEFLSLGKSADKYIPTCIKELSSRQISIFLDSYRKGDGSIYKGRMWDGYQCNDYRVFYTSSKQIASDLSEMILKIGKRPSFKVKPAIEIYDPKRDKKYLQNSDIIVVSELTNKFAYMQTLNHTIIQYDGYIYDVELEKNHTLFIRRNGKVCVSGNCRCRLTEYRNGEEWDKEKKQFILTIPEKPRVERKKVKVIAGDKEYFV